MSPDLLDTIVFEDIPDAPPRPPGKGREPVKWEEILAPLEQKLHNTPARLWAYNNKAGASSRVSAVRGRLFKAAPEKNWELKVRPVPDTDLWGVYAVFHGLYSPEEIKARNADRAKRRAAAASRSDVLAGTPTDADSQSENAVPTAPPQTPKERLAAQAAAKK